MLTGIFIILGLWAHTPGVYYGMCLKGTCPASACRSCPSFAYSQRGPLKTSVWPLTSGRHLPVLSSSYARQGPFPQHFWLTCWHLGTRPLGQSNIASYPVWLLGLSPDSLGETFGLCDRCSHQTSGPAKSQEKAGPGRGCWVGGGSWSGGERGCPCFSPYLCISQKGRICKCLQPYSLEFPSAWPPVLNFLPLSSNHRVSVRRGRGPSPLHPVAFRASVPHGCAVGTHEIFLNDENL